MRTIFSVFVSTFLFLFSWSSGHLLALDPGKAFTQYNVKAWNMEDGLPGNFVFAILQTQDGYLWLGTQNGLVRFDGLNFELFTRETIPPLNDNDIRALYEDRNRTLWIGTKSGGLTRYKEGEFTTYPIKAHPALYRIRAIEEDRWGNLWIGSFERGLTSLRKGKFTTYTAKQGLPDKKVRAIYKDGSGDLWVTTTGGIVKLVKPGIFQPPASQDLLPQGKNKTACLYEKDTENLWIGTGDSGLFRLRSGVLNKYGTGEGIPNQTITYLYRDRLKNLWIGTDGGGLARMSKGVLSTLPAGDGPADSFINSIYEDREGSLWVGTVKGGLYQLRNSKFTTYSTREGLAHYYIFCIHESRTRGLWIGTRGGLNRLKQGTLTTELTTGTGLLNNNVVCLFEDLSGYLWIGTWGGLHRFKDGELATLTTKDGLSDNKITYILGDNRGDTWIGTKNGLNQFNNKNGTFKVFTTKEGLSSNAVNFIFKDRKGNLWVGTDAGLNRFNSGHFTPYNLSTGTGSNSFRCVYQDDEDVLWFGTSSGLARLKEKDTTLYTIECGLIENNVVSILEDEKGYLWLAGQNGISRISKKELEDFCKGKIMRIQPDSYDEKDGMKFRWVTSAGCKTRDGRFWFPTLGGVAMIDPNHIDVAAIPPSTIIEKLIVDGESIETHAIVKGKKVLELAPGKKRLEFHYKGVSFINPQKIGFKIKLAGYDSDWVNMKTKRSTTYTDLSPGRYTFEVISRNPGGDWNEEGTSFSFHLKPYFYQATWFYVIAALSIFLSVFAAYRFRVRQLKSRTRELETLVKGRTMELENAYRELRESKEIIEEKNRNTMASIRYARKIQQTMLPMKAKMEKHFKDSFVLYLPKDIVSGDFYWFDIIEDHYFLALADCTGHGVPGALLSIVGYMMLNEVLHERRLLDPAKILTRLHQGFRYVLKQEIEDIDTLDGMDVALCVIEKNKKKITFAGARRPLYLVRCAVPDEKSQNGEIELIIIKGDRKSIGGRQREKERIFSSKEIEVGAGDMIYLTTDGFSDQHNREGQKYGSQRLRAFLPMAAKLPLFIQQQYFKEELLGFMGEEEQRDDITVIGVRMQ